ncbi:hypothetical protein CW304_06600 [Bacillus sp. UFRGS-B20]|nr:hypothetical protein CW304_06600 [Bacillus sp. UFRGS-B20]
MRSYEKEHFLYVITHGHSKWQFRIKLGDIAISYYERWNETINYVIHIQPDLFHVLEDRCLCILAILCRCFQMMNIIRGIVLRMEGSLLEML